VRLSIGNKNRSTRIIRYKEKISLTMYIIRYDPAIISFDKLFNNKDKIEILSKNDCVNIIYYEGSTNIIQSL